MSNRFETSKRRLLADRLARWTVTAGGLGIIASIMAILLFIGIEAIPLTAGAEVDVGPARALPEGGEILAAVVDEYRSHTVLLDAAGHVLVLDDEADVEARHSLADEDLVLVRGETPPGSSTLTAATDDGRVVLVEIDWRVTFDGGTRRVAPTWEAPTLLEMDPTGAPVAAFAARQLDDGSVAVGQLGDGTLRLVRRRTRENLLTGEVTADVTAGELPSPYRLTELVLDSAGRNLYAGTRRGEILWWQLRGTTAGEPQILSAGPSAVTALSLLIGDRSLLVGQEDGSLSVWFAVRDEADQHRLTLIREFPALPDAVRMLLPSLRNRSFIAHDEGGAIGLYHATSRQTLWRADSPLPGATAAYFAPRADAASLVGGGRVVELSIDSPHPEATWRTLFGKVWYEGYEEPAYVWQSSGSTDAAEPKLSLVPLLVGTLKGTFYSLFLAIPLGVFGAMYTSQFMDPAYKRAVKPVVEIMAALPSVVLGFLAGLWLAPRLAQAFPALVLMAFVIPLVVWLTGLAWYGMPRQILDRFPAGTESLVFVAVLALAAWGCVGLGNLFETTAFGGNFQAWLLESFALPYDQRNAVVVGLAMGFAVIPIIFSISEDAFSNVPYSLVAGSLALGASRWQTVTRVVLPTASPGIFSAVMVGFGRAVGETMIVLMATGNTPIMDWNPFNGFRTLSANIAVEIPEAPQHGTLYRVLFLSALLLFLLTFVINTVAEIVRQALRRRYAQL